MDNIFSAYHYACKTKADREACKEYAEEAKKFGVEILSTIYPVGSIYISTTETCPIADLGVGTWELVAEDRVLQGAGTRGAVGTELAESLPNINASVQAYVNLGGGTTGAFSTSGTKYKGTDGGSGGEGKLTLNASNSSSTYQDDAPVQPDAYLVNIFRRIA